MVSLKNNAISIVGVEMKIKLNVGASPIWKRADWHVMDHKPGKNHGVYITGDAAKRINLEDETCSAIFTSHTLEHIPHFRVPRVLMEFSRVLEKGGLLRMSVPNLRRVAEAYVNRDTDFFNRLRQEDEKIRTDLGFGGMFMNFIVSPGQDTILVDRNLSEFIGGYAHLYAYDFEMLEILLKEFGFEDIRQSSFCESSMKELCEPLHVEGMEPTWQNLNQEFFAKNGLVHQYKDGKYHINFNLTGFDAYPNLSLFVEARKGRTVAPTAENDFNRQGAKNFNHYGGSLLNDPAVIARLEQCGIGKGYWEKK